MKKTKNKNPAVPGFKAAGLHCGIKDKKIKDLALVVSEVPATAAAVFTKNRVVSPGVTWSRRALAKSGSCRAVVVNSGNANAVTGPKGLKDCDTITQKVAKELGIPQNEVFIASTGIIGVPLPLEKIIKATPKLISKLGKQAKNWTEASEAIMTTDLVSKSDKISYTFKNQRIEIGGITKGSGMIHPNMATMLGVILTDVALSPDEAQQLLCDAVNDSFNCISVEGHMSTNDTVLILANGLAGNSKLSSKDLKTFQTALNHVCLELAKMIARDGEGVTRLVTVRVKGAKTQKHADAAARAVGNSALVKTSWNGGDPNWGRIIDALGYSPAKVVEEKVDIAYSAPEAKKLTYSLKKGRPTRTSFETLCAAVAPAEFDLHINLNLGKGQATLYAADLTEEYVDFNKGDVSDPASLGG